MSQSIGSIRKFASSLILEHIQKYPQTLTQPVAESFPAAVLFADIKGFTALTNRYTRENPEVGVKELAVILNLYMGMVVDLITENGGDVVKFAGDALFATWRVTKNDSLPTEVHRAVQCGMQIQNELHEYPVNEDTKLSLRIGIGAGQMHALHVGGAFKRWELLLAGEPMNQVGHAGKIAEPGQVVISNQVRKYIEFLGGGEKQNKTLFKLQQHQNTQTQAPLIFPDIPTDGHDKLKTYIPRAILSRLKDGKDAWDADFRPVTVIFCKVKGFEYSPRLPVEEVQNIMKVMQDCIYKYEGSINRFGIDDKGAVLLAAFGLPPLKHGDDALRGVLAAKELLDRLDEAGYGGVLGISTGNVFCGSVGNEIRCEYTMHGNNVNFAARLMQHASTVLVDEPTFNKTRGHMDYEVLEPIKVKGRNEYMKVYRPLYQSTKIDLEALDDAK